MRFIAARIVTSLMAVSGAQAQAQAQAPAGADHAQHHPSAASPQSDGEVRKVDREQGKVTVRHGPLANLDMPAMTMVFRVADPKMLDKLNEGDKIKFTAERVQGNFTLMAVEPAK